jgi:hypothetical protein
VTQFERRRLLLASFSQKRSAAYAALYRRVRDDYIGTWLGRFVFRRQDLLELAEQHAALSEIHALNARMLMGWQDE